MSKFVVVVDRRERRIDIGSPAVLWGGRQCDMLRATMQFWDVLDDPVRLYNSVMCWTMQYDDMI